MCKAIGSSPHNYELFYYDTFFYMYVIKYIILYYVGNFKMHFCFDIDFVLVYNSSEYHII